MSVKCCHKGSSRAVTTTAIADTGAEATICGPDLIKRLHIEKLHTCDSNEKLIGASRKAISTIGKTKLCIFVDNKDYDEEVIVCENQKEMLLSFNTCLSLNLIPKGFTE